jgi:hypothetical protein
MTMHILVEIGFWRYTNELDTEYIRKNKNLELCNIALAELDNFGKTTSAFIYSKCYFYSKSQSIEHGCTEID